VYAGGPSDTSLKNSKSAKQILQVVLASAPTAKTRVFASKHAQRRHAPPTAVSALHVLLRLLLVLGSALGAFGQLQGHFIALQEARRSPHGRRYVLHSWWELWWELWWEPW
jgi:hypothetical protein